MIALERNQRASRCSPLVVWCVWAACLTASSLGRPADTGDSRQFSESRPAVSSAGSLPSTLPSGAYQTPPTPGVPYSKLFRNTGVPYTNPVDLPPLAPSVRTESIEARTRLGLPAINFGGSLLQRGFEPQDADLKFGPLFFKLGNLSAAALWSDNINLTETNRESGTIAIVTLSGAVVAQLTEGLRIAVSGTFVYLPLKNEAGISGFGLYAPFVFGLSEDPSLRSEITWNTIIGGWNVVFADDFTIGIGRYSNNFRDDAVIFAGGGFDGFDRAGRYSFGGGGRTFSRSGRGSDQSSETDILYFSNIVSAQTDRLIVGKTRLRIQASHENLWYNQGNRGLPSLRDQVTVSLVSERENLRFKPFIVYQALRTDVAGSFGQTVRAGVDGPITDQLQLHADVGYFFGENQDSLLWAVNLRHQAGPYTEESLYFGRSVSSFHDEISEVLGYNIRQILGPRIVANAFFSRNNVRNLTGRREDQFSRVEYRTGLRIAIVAGPRTNFSLTGTYGVSESDDSHFTTLTGLAEVSHRFTDTFVARLLYQYQEHDSDFREDSYYENLVYLSLTKYFN